METCSNISYTMENNCSGTTVKWKVTIFHTKQPDFRNMFKLALESKTVQCFLL